MDEIEINVKLAAHESDINHLKKQMETLNKMADEIHVMATNISTLTMELKHTNEHILSNDKHIEKTDVRIDELESKPNKRWNLIMTTIISVLTSTVVGAVVGATYPEMGAKLRKLMPHTYILVPGYGAQGGKGADLVNFFNEDGFG